MRRWGCGRGCATYRGPLRRGGLALGLGPRGAGAGLRPRRGGRWAAAVAPARPPGCAAGEAVVVRPAGAYGGDKDVSDAWATGVLAVGPGPTPVPEDEALAVPLHQRESGRSALRSWSWTVASRARKPSASRGRGSRPQAPRHAACPVTSQVLAHLVGLRCRRVDDRVRARRRWHRPCDGPPRARILALQHRTSSARVRTGSGMTHNRRGKGLWDS